MTREEIIAKLFDITNKSNPYDKRRAREYNTESNQGGDYPLEFEEIFGFFNKKND